MQFESQTFVGDLNGVKTMYEKFFGFEEKPFTHTPNTKFIYLSEQHNGVLRTLLYGIESRLGFMVLTGEVGSGKTTTIRSLCHLLSQTIEVSLILNPLVSTIDLLKSINRDFGNAWQSDSTQDQLQTLNTFLLDLNTQGKTAVVIIDEAQNLSNEALEMTRMLSNLETESQKLINIILVGQPELESVLSQTALRQLAQRIQIHAKLKPLSFDETSAYIQHRLNCAGKKSYAKFEGPAIKRIFKKSGGIPRIINNLCDMSLLAAFCQNTYLVDKKIITQAIKEVPSYVSHP